MNKAAVFVLLSHVDFTCFHDLFQRESQVTFKIYSRNFIGLHTKPKNKEKGHLGYLTAARPLVLLLYRFDKHLSLPISQTTKQENSIWD